MKHIKAIILLTLAIGMIGCEKKKEERNFQLAICNGDGWGASITRINCDSFQMVTSKKAFIWVNGQKMNIEADKVITPSSNY